MKYRKFLVFLVGLGAVAGAAEPAKAPPAGTATAASLAQTALHGMLSLLQRGGGGMQGAPEAMACARKIPAAKLAPVFLEAINKEFSEAERRELDAFSSSSAAAKARRLSEIEGDRNRGIATPGDAPRLTAEEARQLSDFDDSALSRRLYMLSESSPALRSRANTRMVELLEGCGFR